MTDSHLDHLVYAVPGLVAGVAEFAARTGVTPAAGGSHPGGTPTTSSASARPPTWRSSAR
ncbi:VOC family protein [Streptosporangium album]|uniref:VOC family protein n=1 Tax=Streptosporangium album TaxID=47479 RepID=UPI0028AA88EE|nr:VOC family protein [Streptosporangium album]